MNRADAVFWPKAMEDWVSSLKQCVFWLSSSTLIAAYAYDWKQVRLLGNPDCCDLLYALAIQLQGFESKSKIEFEVFE